MKTKKINKHIFNRITQSFIIMIEISFYMIAKIKYSRANIALTVSSSSNT